MSQSIFSDQWYKLSGLHPFLRPTVVVERQWIRSELWHLLTPSTGSGTYRLNDVAFQFIGRCNGQRSIQQIWEDLLSSSPESTLTQQEAIDLLVALQGKGFVEFEQTADARQLIESMVQERQRETRQRLNPLAFKVKLGNPQPWLSRIEWLAPWVFGLSGLCVFVLSLLIGSFIAIENAQSLSHYATTWLATPRLILLVWLVYPFIKFVHETAHALAVMRWGGRIQEVGVSLMLLFPVPYVDASDANRFERPYQRALVGAAGIFAELFLAVLGLIVWSFTQPGWIQDIAFVVAFTGGVSTLVFNGNPLIKMDAYFVMSDLLQMPNLAQRSQSFFKHAVQKVLLGIKGLKPIERSAGEWPWLMAYGPVSWLYRLSITIWIVLWIGEFSPTVGYVMAALGVATLFVIPLLKGFWFLHKDLSAGPGSGRWQTNTRALVLIALAVGLIFVVPMPERRIVAGVVWIAEKAQIKAHGDGFIQAVLHSNGSPLNVGDDTLKLEDPAATAQYQRLLAKREGVQAQLAQSFVVDLAKARQYQVELDQLQQELRVLEEKRAELSAKALVPGLVYLKDSHHLVGRYAKRGDVLGYVVQASDTKANPASNQLSTSELDPIVRVVVEQDDVALLKGRVRGVELVLAGREQRQFSSQLIRDTPAALAKLPSAALGEGGGGELMMDPTDKEGLRTARPTFAFDVALPFQANNGLVGQKAFVRFDLGSSPLASQWYRRAQQAVLLRFAPADI